MLEILGHILNRSLLLTPHNQTISKSVSPTLKACPEVIPSVCLHYQHPCLASASHLIQPDHLLQLV